MARVQSEGAAAVEAAHTRLADSHAQAVNFQRQLADSNAAYEAASAKLAYASTQADGLQRQVVDLNAAAEAANAKLAATEEDRRRQVEELSAEMENVRP